jgi:hypothetical protein
MTYTPGPWKAYPISHGIVDASFVHKWAIAEANPKYPNKPHGIEMNQANARLIAAAPKMLAALHNACRAMEDWELLGEGSRKAFKSQIYEAIAEAEGKICS